MDFGVKRQKCLGFRQTDLGGGGDVPAPPSKGGSHAGPGGWGDLLSPTGLKKQSDGVSLGPISEFSSSPKQSLNRAGF